MAKKKGRGWETESEILDVSKDFIWTEFFQLFGLFRGFYLDRNFPAFFFFIVQPLLFLYFFFPPLLPPERKKQWNLFSSTYCLSDWPFWPSTNPQYGSLPLFFCLFILWKESWELGKDEARSPIPSPSWVFHDLTSDLFGENMARSSSNQVMNAVSAATRENTDKNCQQGECEALVWRQTYWEELFWEGTQRHWEN